MEKIFNNRWSIVVILAAIALTAFLVFQNASKVEGAAFTGLSTTIATTTNPSVGTTALVIIATSTNCASRIITSRAAPLMLTFSDYNNATPTATFGHLQPASSTVVYDSGLWGCGKVKAYAYTTDTITVTETQ